MSIWLRIFLIVMACSTAVAAGIVNGLDTPLDLGWRISLVNGVVMVLVALISGDE